MHHPIIILLPVLMLTDYYLTLWSVILKEKQYDTVFKTTHFELNPVMRCPIAQKRWFSPRHLLGTAIVTASFVFLMESDAAADWFVQGLTSCLFVFLGVVIARHVANILTFRRMIRKSDDISGQVCVSHGYILDISLYQAVGSTVPLVLLVLIAPSPSTIGGASGAVLVALVHRLWIWRHRKSHVVPSSASDIGEEAGGEQAG